MKNMKNMIEQRSLLNNDKLLSPIDESYTLVGFPKIFFSKMSVIFDVKDNMNMLQDSFKNIIRKMCKTEDKIFRNPTKFAIIDYFPTEEFNKKYKNSFSIGFKDIIKYNWKHMVFYFDKYYRINIQYLSRHKLLFNEVFEEIPLFRKIYDETFNIMCLNQNTIINKLMDINIIINNGYNKKKKDHLIELYLKNKYKLLINNS